MPSILELPTAQALAWALVNFVWQGAAIALVAVAVQRYGRLSASARYTVGVVAMAAMLVAPAITFVRLAAAPAPGDTAAASNGSPAPGTQHPPSPPASARQAPAPGTDLSALRTQHPAPSTPMLSVAPTVILLLWTAGVVVLSLRLLGGWFVARRLAHRSTSPATPEIQAMARMIAGRLALDRIVGVFESSAVTVPVMIGWMKPVVLLPAAALAGLSLPQVEALLAHELAHVRRHDYLVNLLQSVVETLLFYHPAVWWVSGRMRVDRELCCDDVALEVCDRIVYATALSDLAAMATAPRMALAATDGPLLNRVRRILGRPADRQDSGSGWLSVCLVVLLVGAVAPSALTSGSEPQSAGVQADVVGGVQSDVAGGMQSGVLGGVQSGAAGGVQPAVVGGVQSGVVGGVQGGVASGVASGVVGGVQGSVASEPQEVPTQIPDVRAADQAREARAKKVDEERRQLELARVDNEFRHERELSQSRLAELESDLKLVQQQYERAKQQVAAGLNDSSVLTELQSRIAKVYRGLNLEKAEFEYQAQNFELKRRELALDREFMATADDKRALLIERDKVKEEQAARMKMIGEDGAPLAPSEVARAGDIVSIVIHNEPDLPKGFVVQTDGTIRFPFLGAIRVQGLTARQVQEALGKQLADRKLAAGSGIEVTLRRPKAPGTGR